MTTNKEFDPLGGLAVVLGALWVLSLILNLPKLFLAVLVVTLVIGIPAAIYRKIHHE